MTNYVDGLAPKAGVNKGSQVFDLAGVRKSVPISNVSVESATARST